MDVLQLQGVWPTADTTPAPGQGGFRGIAEATGVWLSAEAVAAGVSGFPAFPGFDVGITGAAEAVEITPAPVGGGSGGRARVLRFAVPEELRPAPGEQVNVEALAAWVGAIIMVIEHEQD